MKEDRPENVAEMEAANARPYFCTGVKEEKASSVSDCDRIGSFEVEADAGWTFSGSEAILSQIREMRFSRAFFKCLNANKVLSNISKGSEGIETDKSLGDTVRERLPYASVLALLRTCTWVP